MIIKIIIITIDILFKGWIKNVRRLKNNIFLDIDDGSTSKKFQLVVPRNAETQQLASGSVISALGRVQVAPNGLYELHANEVQSLGKYEYIKFSYDQFLINQTYSGGSFERWISVLTQTKACP